MAKKGRKGKGDSTKVGGADLKARITEVIQ